ncbi:PEP-CTERM protein-sorting domain-containing protein [Klenkia brasiliensis]|uniref:PEP-CTERM protein-sorting domain-containing protein n=1 Tax=Klenkia brasiliensis TaxID=333142 RepID=A0A1G7QPK9_9ACTN|nr:PEP-CTERM protein-sorting domain-containing protein [Klenkia brasiliensis]
MFLAPLVPALLVVVVGYVAGYGATTLVDHALGGALGPRTPEVVGWLTGLVLLVGVLWWLLRRRRRADRHQK